MARVSPFTKTVISSMRHLYPEALADKSFDNTGLLLEAPIPSQLPPKNNSVLLTVDLTKAVADEAIEENHSAVVAYHPIIFRGLKAITLDDPQQQTLLRLACHGISVYSPHTAVDIVPEGMTDWLCDIVTGKIKPDPEPKAFTAEVEKEQEQEREAAVQPSETDSETDVTTSEESEPKTPSDANVNGNVNGNGNGNADPLTDDSKSPQPKRKRPTAVHRTYSRPSYSSQAGNQEQQTSPHRSPSPIQSSPNTTFHYDVISHSRSVITPSPSSALDAANAAHPTSSPSSSPYYTPSNTGSGRLINFDSPQPLSALITRIAHATGTPKGFPIAIPQSKSLESIRIRTVGICPGSGSSVIRNCKEPPDLVFTGEISHHEALAVIERGGCVIMLFHSNSERGYLDGVMRDKLEGELSRRWDEARKERNGDEEEEDEVIKEILEDESVSVVTSRCDRDPFGIVVLQESQVEGEKVG